MDLGQISARGVHRVIRVAWTLADLAGVPRPAADHTSGRARPVAGGAPMTGGQDAAATGTGWPGPC